MSPKISVCLATYNPRQDYLAKTLEGVRKQTLPHDMWEFLLIDNNSQPPLEGTISLTDLPQARIVVEKKPGLSHARRRGFEKAKGDLIVNLDDDVVLDPDYLEQVVKLAGEQYLRTFAQLTGSRATALRFFNVYGPRQDPANPYSGVISKFIDAAHHQSIIGVCGDGAQTHDFIYVADIANACLAASERTRGALYECLNIGTGLATTVNALRRLVIRLTSSAGGFTHLAAREGEIRDSVCNPTKANELIGFVAETKRKMAWCLLLPKAIDVTRSRFPTIRNAK